MRGGALAEHSPASLSLRAESRVRHRTRRAVFLRSARKKEMWSGPLHRHAAGEATAPQHISMREEVWRPLHRMRPAVPKLWWSTGRGCSLCRSERAKSRALQRQVYMPSLVGCPAPYRPNREKGTRLPPALAKKRIERFVPRARPTEADIEPPPTKEMQRRSSTVRVQLRCSRDRSAQLLLSSREVVLFALATPDALGAPGGSGFRMHRPPRVVGTDSGDSREERQRWAPLAAAESFSRTSAGFAAPCCCRGPPAMEGTPGAPLTSSRAARASAALC